MAVTCSVHHVLQEHHRQEIMNLVIYALWIPTPPASRQAAQTALGSAPQKSDQVSAHANQDFSSLDKEQICSVCIIPPLNRHKGPPPSLLDNLRDNHHHSQLPLHPSNRYLIQHLPQPINPLVSPHVNLHLSLLVLHLPSHQSNRRAIHRPSRPILPVSNQPHNRPLVPPDNQAPIQQYNLLPSLLHHQLPNLPNIHLRHHRLLFDRHRNHHLNPLSTQLLSPPVNHLLAPRVLLVLFLHVLLCQVILPSLPPLRPHRPRIQVRSLQHNLPDNQPTLHPLNLRSFLRPILPPIYLPRVRQANQRVVLRPYLPVQLPF